MISNGTAMNRFLIFTSSDNVDFQDSKLGFNLVSKFEEQKSFIKMYLNKKELWSIPEFIGKRAYKYSSDGNKLMLYGHLHLGLKELLLDPDYEVASLFKDGQKILSVKLKDLYSDPNKSAKELGVLVKGGGWILWADMIKSVEVDWNKSELTFELPKGKVVKKF